MSAVLNPPKVLFWETNFAGKLSQFEFIHISKAPEGHITESMLEQQTFEIRTIDSSHPPVRVKVSDFVKITLASISDRLAMRSHGITAFDLQCKLLEAYPNYNRNTILGVYFYKVVAF